MRRYLITVSAVQHVKARDFDVLLGWAVCASAHGCSACQMLHHGLNSLSALTHDSANEISSLPSCASHISSAYMPFVTFWRSYHCQFLLSPSFTPVPVLHDYCGRDNGYMQHSRRLRDKRRNLSRGLIPQVRLNCLFPHTFSVAMIFM